MSKVKKAFAKIVKPASTQTLKVLGKTVYIIEDKNFILRIGHTTKTIHGSRLFSILDKKIQEFMVYHVSCLVKSKTKGHNRFFKVDKMALDFIAEKYPKKPLQYWYSALIAIFSDTFPSELNKERIDRINKIVTKKTNVKKGTK
jgi:hypothetical protein